MEPTVPAENPPRALALKLKVLRLHAQMSPESLAVAAGIPVAQLLAAESGGGVLEYRRSG